MVLDLIPVEMRCPSVITVLLFAIGVPLFWYLHHRITSLETVMIARCIDIEKLSVFADGLEKAMQSIKDDNKQTSGWIRQETTALGDRIEKDIAEMRKEIHRGN